MHVPDILSQLGISAQPQHEDQGLVASDEDEVPEEIAAAWETSVVRRP